MRYSGVDPPVGGSNCGDTRWHYAQSTLGRERELELRQRWVELVRELRDESERVECWQPGCFPLLFSFPAFFKRGFCNETLAPSTYHATNLFDFSC